MRARTTALCLGVAGLLILFNGAKGSTAPSQTNVSPRVMAERIIFQTPPRYPAEAREARLQGRVDMEVVIDDEGAVAELRVITGHPLLSVAAEDAVWQWLYDPYTVGGQPVAVTTTISVTFTLN